MPFFFEEDDFPENDFEDDDVLRDESTGRVIEFDVELELDDEFEDDEIEDCDG